MAIQEEIKHEGIGERKHNVARTLLID